MTQKRTYLLLSLLCSLLFSVVLGGQTLAQESTISGTVLETGSELTLSKVNVVLNETGVIVESNNKGAFIFEDLDAGNYSLSFFLEDYELVNKQIELLENQVLELVVLMEKLEVDLEEVEINDDKKAGFETGRMRNVEDMAIHAAKKTELIELERVAANLATNNSRQIYKGIAGLNIWENDGAGLQLSIGARGLDPNRTSNFNTRQNGYDISADALGYPESYYTPPSHALQKIEIVRGAASLQYGPQFGGLLNFVFKKGNEQKAFEFETLNTIGSFGLFNTFNSIGGQKNKLNYYAFYQGKRGNGWRPNSEFNQHTAFGNIHFEISPKLQIGLEYTFMNYLAQQAGGLVDYEFLQDPRQSKRERNWFKVNWNLGALKIDYKLSDKTKLNNRTFVLNAERSALGELGPINRPDPLRERDLIVGQYKNIGNETRFIHRYNIKDQYATLLLGARIYRGFSTSQLGNANDGNAPDFEYLNPNDLEGFEYEFPSLNLAFFAENLFYINPKWTVTPGFRLEQINTASDGSFKRQVISGGQVIFEETFTDKKSNNRTFVLTGLGTSYKYNNIELYGNFSQNFRSINFSDLVQATPNIIVDSLLMDERGYNIDLGLRGEVLKNRVRFDASLFYLRYKNRIGIGEITIPDPVVIEKTVAFRTNIGDARVWGLESVIESILLPSSQDKDRSISHFLNFSWLNGEYLSGLSSYVGNNVELVPPISIKTGLNFRYKTFKLSYQYSYVAQHYSDATNAITTAAATRGIIPAYNVHDLSADFRYKKFQISTGINNLFNTYYFTRRANAYPGPGIIPSDGRNFYLTLGVRL